MQCIVETLGDNLKEFFMWKSADLPSLLLLSSFPNLLRLSLENSQNITNKIVKIIFKSCKLLEDLNMINCSRLTDKSLINASKYYPYLRSISLDRCYQITDKGIMKLSHFANLEFISLSFNILFLSYFYSNYLINNIFNNIFNYILLIYY